MTKRLILLFVIVCGLVTPAFADPTADAKAHSEAFAKAANACDTKAVVALYADDAVAVWPGQGEEATGKAAIEKLVTNFCSNGKHVLKMGPFEARALGKDYIVNVGHWEDSFTSPDGKTEVAQIRTSEVLKKSDGKWLYLVDHASMGTPPAAPQATPTK